MASAPTPQSEQDRLERLSGALAQRVKYLEITDQPSYKGAAEILREIAIRRKMVTEHHAPLKQKAHEAHRAICEAENRLLRPLAEAEGTLKRMIATYEQEQRRLAEAARLEAERAARLEQEKLIAQQVAAAEAAGAHPVEVEAMMTAPRPTVFVPETPAFTRAAGVSTRPIYTVEVFDRDVSPARAGFERDRLGIDHGIIMADHKRRRPWLGVPYRQYRHAAPADRNSAGGPAVFGRGSFHRFCNLEIRTGPLPGRAGYWHDRNPLPG